MQNDISKFVQWAKPLTIELTKAPADVARKMLMRLPGAESEQLVEIPNADTPSTEVLDMRCSSW